MIIRSNRKTIVTTRLFNFLSIGTRNFAFIGTSRDGKINYTDACLEKWRADLQSKPDLKSSRGKPCSYTDDEIVTWRAEFDEYSQSVITEKNFEKKVAKKYPELSGPQLHEKVSKKWNRFDLNGDGSICFSEFCIMSFCLDVERLAEQLQNGGGLESVFEKYASGGLYLDEACVKKVMQDYNFTCVIDADVRKTFVLMDANKDGKVCKSDMMAFVKAEADREK